MSVQTFIQRFRFNRKVEQEKTNAGQISPARNTTIARMMGIPAFALAFCFALIGLTQPASAAINFDLNGTVGPILDGVSALIPSIVNLIISIVPAIIVLAIVGFILKFLDQILAMLHLK